MTVDGCKYSFADLAHRIVPRYMAELSLRMANPIPLSDFNVQGVGSATLRRRFRLDHDPSGCYVFLDNSKPIYVGISRRIIRRLREHVRGGYHFSATLAYRIAFARQPHRTTAKLAMQEPSFRAQFDQAQEYIRGLDVAFIEIANPVELYLFEAYCAMELQTGLDSGGWNTFETH